jgi:hypothetical protein
MESDRRRQNDSFTDAVIGEGVVPPGGQDWTWENERAHSMQRIKSAFGNDVRRFHEDCSSRGKRRGFFPCGRVFLPCAQQKFRFSATTIHAARDWQSI